MRTLLHVPIESLFSRIPESAKIPCRILLRTECDETKLHPAVLTISPPVTVAISGTGFNPWNQSPIVSELINSNGKLCSDVKLIAKPGRQLFLCCKARDLTPAQYLSLKNPDKLYSKHKKGSINESVKPFN